VGDPGAEVAHEALKLTQAGDHAPCGAGVGGFELGQALAAHAPAWDSAEVVSVNAPASSLLGGGQVAALHMPAHHAFVALHEPCRLGGGHE